MQSKKKKTKSRKTERSDSKKPARKVKRTAKSEHSPRREQKRAPRVVCRSSRGSLATSKRGPQALLDTEEKYHALFNQAREGIALIDSRTGHIIDCNPEFENLSGRKLKGLKKMKIWELRPPGKVQGAKKKFLEIKEKGTGGSGELEFQKPDGEIVSVEFVSKVVKTQGKQYIQSLVRDITERKQMQAKMHKLALNLSERLKELNCLYGISDLVDEFGFSLSEILMRIVDLIPSSWQYPEITCARVILEDQVFRTKNFRETIWKQSSNIIVHGERVGTLEVCYLEEKPQRDEGPFLKEERSLINAISQRLGKITERKRAEETLEQTNRRLETLLDHTHMMVAYLDPQFNFVKVNRAYAKADQREPSFYPGKNHFDLYPNPENEIIFQRVVQTGEPYFTYAKAFEYAEHPERGVTYWDWSLIPIKDSSGAVAGLVLTVQNVTERKQAEQALEWELASKGALAKLSGALITPSSSIDDIANIVLDSAKSLTKSEHGYVSSIEPKTGDNVGHTLTKMMGKQCLVRGEDRRIRFPIGPDGRYPRLWGHALNTRQAFFTNCPDKHKVSQGIPGGHIPIRNFLSVPAIIGEELMGQIALANSAKDYTEQDLSAIERLAELYAMAIQRRRAEEALRESEEKFRNLAEQSPNMIFINKKGRVVYANKKSEEIMGYKREEFYSSDFDFFKLIAPEYVDLVNSNLSKHMKGEEVPPYEYALITRGGEKIQAIHTTKLIKYEGENSILGIVTDITMRKKAEEEIQKLNESLKFQASELAAANKELEAFSYSVSHDLRAPLRAIDSFSRVLLEDYVNRLDPTGKDYLRRVQEATQRMRQLIDDLLKLALTMRAEMKREKTNLSELAHTITAELQRTHPKRQVESVIQQGVLAYGDPRLLREVLENLLGNAWKFTEKHSQAKIEFGATQKEGQTVYFVRDDGAGFDMSYVNKLFIPFQRLHSTSEFSGNGIGLALVSRIVNRHGGRIWAEGEMEKGATFYFTL